MFGLTSRAVFHLTITSETSAAIQRKAVKSRFVVSANVMTDAYRKNIATYNGK